MKQRLYTISVLETCNFILMVGRPTLLFSYRGPPSLDDELIRMAVCHCIHVAQHYNTTSVAMDHIRKDLCYLLSNGFYQ